MGKHPVSSSTGKMLIQCWPVVGCSGPESTKYCSLFRKNMRAFQVRFAEIGGAFYTSYMNVNLHWVKSNLKMTIGQKWGTFYVVNPSLQTREDTVHYTIIIFEQKPAKLFNSNIWQLKASPMKTIN